MVKLTRRRTSEACNAQRGKLFLLGLIALALVLSGTGSALAGDARQASEPVTIYYFWGDGCPHCAEAKPFLEGLAQRYPNVQLRDFEVWYPCATPSRHAASGG